MKSAYELAMERLNKSSPAIKLTAEQKKEIAELDSLYASKIAQRDGRLVEMYLFAALVYFVISLVASILVRRLQRRVAIVR